MTGITEINRRRSGLGIGILFFVALLTTTSTLGQDQTETPPTEELTADRIEAARKKLTESASIDPETKKKAESAYATALENLAKVEEFRQAKLRNEQATNDIKSRIDQMKDKLARLQKTEPFGPGNLNLSELEQEISRRELELSNLKMQLTKAEAEPANRVSRRREIRNLLLGYNQKLAENQQKIDQKPAANEVAEIIDSRRTALLSERMRILAEQPSLQSELAKYDAEDTAGYLRLQRDVLAKETRLAEDELQMFQERLTRRRAESSAAKLDEAEAAALNAPATLKEFAEGNVKIAKEAFSLSGPIRDATRKLNGAQTQLETIQKQFKVVEQRVNEIGLTGSIGTMLRRQKSELPDLRALRKELQDRKTLIEDIQYKAFEFDDQRSESVNDGVQKLLLEVPLANRSEKLEEEARTLVQKRREYLDDVIRSQKNYLDTLFDLDATQQLLILESNKYNNYIDERVLWIRSNKPLYASFSIDPSDKWALDPENWRTVGNKYLTDFRNYPFLYIPVFIIIAYLILRKPKLRRELEEQGKIAQRGTCFSFRPTLNAALITLLLAISFPGLISFLAWRLNLLANGSPFARALAQAMFVVTWTFFPLEIMRRVCRLHGLAEAHFEWPRPLVAVVRRNVQWFIPISLGVSFVMSLLFYSATEHQSDTIERLVFILGLIVLAVFLRRILDKENGILRWYQSEHPDSMFVRGQKLILWGSLIVPLLLAGMTFVGFYFTAQRLTWEIYTTVLFLLTVLLLYSFSQRMLNLRRRAIKISQARARLASNAISEDQEVETITNPIDAILPTEDSQPDIAANTEQTKKLIQTGVIMTTIIGTWLIWVDVLPALKMLDRWPVWTTTVANSIATELPQATMPGQPSAMASTETKPPEIQTEKIEAVTIADIGFAIIIGIATFVCAQNIPGVLEISLLQRLPLDKSIRYAITTICSYLIVLLGLILAFNAISIGWSKVQWLATALTFGLAFGLQEIFANFVAGLILLFERPIRVGDIVTVDDITGVVSRIRIRATTITNWDRKEYVVPNKEFITGRMLNWTLSDKINRIVINVGIAYGSNVERAKELLLKACQDHPLILDEPKTLITFEGFGDNSLNLVVRTFLPDMENRLMVMDELYTSIDKLFRDEQIEIAFPQRDLHVRSVDPSVLNKLKPNPRQQNRKAG